MTRKRGKLYVLLSLVLALALFSLAAPYLTPNDPAATHADHLNEGPSAAFPLGTDRYGRCVCSRVMAGARTSVFSAVALVAVTFAAGTLLGMLAGYYGGVLDTHEEYARLARAQTLSLKTAPYVSAARLSGCGHVKLLFQYLLPNMIGTLSVSAASQLGAMLVGVAGLSFLGIGVQEPYAEWGSMMNQSRAYLQLNSWPVLAPAAATVVTVMLFHLLGDCVRDCAAVEEQR